MKEEFGILQQDSTFLCTDVSKLQQEVSSIGPKQTEICEQVGGVQQAVLQLGKQMAAMNLVLKSLVPKSVNRNEDEAETSASQVVKSPTLARAELQNLEHRNANLRKHLEAERELNRQFEEAQLQNLPPVRVQKPSTTERIPMQDLTAERNTPVAHQAKPHTPAFQ